MIIPELRTQLKDYLQRIYSSNSQNLKSNYHFFLERLQKHAFIHSIFQSLLDNNPITDEQMEAYRNLFFSKQLRSC